MFFTKRKGLDDELNFPKLTLILRLTNCGKRRMGQ